MTFSIAARCAKTGQFAIAVSSSSPAVAARCAHARAGVGVVASQNITDPTLGPKGLDAMAAGLPAPEALARILAQTPYADFRQVAVVDSSGRTAAHSGARTLGTHAVEQGPGVVAAGNLLSSTKVPTAMVKAFVDMDGAALGDRIIAAMQAAVRAGGEAGPVHSAGLLLVRSEPWPIADLRVDWDEGDPVARLADLWSRWKPEMEAYVTRALNPSAAPSYGVPGDK